MDDFWYVIRSSLARDAELWRGLLADPASLPLRGVAWVVILAGLSEAASDPRTRAASCGWAASPVMASR